MSKETFLLKWGAITFLDFLGWKGIWMNDYKNQVQSHKSEIFNCTSLQTLAKLIQTIEEIYQNENKEITFISISDTIVLFLPCNNNDNDNYNALKCHANVCNKILDLSAETGFALRGAITIGDYSHFKNIIVGPGVDECASWYEKANWLGVIFAPSAQFVIDEQRRKKQNGHDVQNNKSPHKVTSGDLISWNDEKIVAYRQIPLKNGFHGIEYCVDWGNASSILNNVLKNTISLSCEIAIKYINTNKYLYALRPGEK